MEAKAELRRAIKERLSRMSENDRRVESQVLVRELEKLIGAATVVCAFIPFIDEPDIRPLLLKLLRGAITIGIPKQEINGMRMFKITSLEDVCKNELTKIPEPPSNEPIKNDEIDVVIIPGRAFTKEGMRLGRGNGGYDRWIEELKKSNPKAMLIGICFESQLLAEIPTEPHDRKMDIVLTPTKIFHS